MRHSVLILLTCLCLSACSTTTRRPAIDDQKTSAEKDLQRDMALKERLKRQERADTVAFRLLTEGSDLCEPKVKPDTGMRLVHGGMYKDEWARSATRIIGKGPAPLIASVAPGSPAQLAGLQTGDRLVAIDNRQLNQPESLAETLDATVKTLEVGKEISIKVQRGDQQIDAHLTPVKACAYPVTVVDNDAVNAYADGKQIVLTSGMMRFVQNDDELGLVLGHELAHNTMGHLNKKKSNSVIGSLIGAAIFIGTGVDLTRLGGDLGAMAFSQDFEAEADYVGLYFAARAGFDVNSAPHFWRRMAVEHPQAIAHGTSHPDTASRFLALEATGKEISAKQQSGVPLHPELNAANLPQPTTSNN